MEVIAECWRINAICWFVNVSPIEHCGRVAICILHGCIGVPVGGCFLHVFWQRQGSKVDGKSIDRQNVERRCINCVHSIVDVNLIYIVEEIAYIIVLNIWPYHIQNMRIIKYWKHIENANMQVILIDVKRWI